MADQADILRHLAAGTMRLAAPTAKPPLVAVAGAKGGVGATTLAVNLAVALSHSGQRVVLADVNPTRSDVALHCGATPRYHAEDVLAGRCQLHEALTCGPAGMQLLAGDWSVASFHEPLRTGHQHRLLDQIGRLGSYADIVLLDVGQDILPQTWQYWQAADDVLLVTAPDAVSVMDAYAAIKTATPHVVDPAVRVVVNQIQSQQEALDVHRRIDHSCQRFLGLSVSFAGGVPTDANVPLAVQQRIPIAEQDPRGPAALAVEQIAGTILDTTEQQATVYTTKIRSAANSMVS